MRTTSSRMYLVKTVKALVLWQENYRDIERMPYHVKARKKNDKKCPKAKPPGRSGNGPKPTSNVERDRYLRTWAAPQEESSATFTSATLFVSLLSAIAFSASITKRNWFIPGTM